jgi:hypothetical protein
MHFPWIKCIQLIWMENVIGVPQFDGSMLTIIPRDTQWLYGWVKHIIIYYLTLCYKFINSGCYWFLLINTVMPKANGSYYISLWIFLVPELNYKAWTKVYYYTLGLRRPPFMQQWRPQWPNSELKNPTQSITQFLLYIDYIKFSPLNVKIKFFMLWIYTGQSMIQIYKYIWIVDSEYLYSDMKYLNFGFL